jgi:hypothetical protein
MLYLRGAQPGHWLSRLFIMISSILASKCQDSTQLGHGHFILNPFLFILQLSFYHLMLCSLDTESVINNPQTEKCYWLVSGRYMIWISNRLLATQTSFFTSFLNHCRWSKYKSSTLNYASKIRIYLLFIDIFSPHSLLYNFYFYQEETCKRQTGWM